MQSVAPQIHSFVFRFSWSINRKEPGPENDIDKI